KISNPHARTSSFADSHFPSLRSLNSTPLSLASLTQSPFFYPPTFHHRVILLSSFCPHPNCFLVSQVKQIMQPCNLWLGLRVTSPMPRASSSTHPSTNSTCICIWKSVELFGCTPLQFCNSIFLYLEG
uniref:Uncharacterized protein n=1 Tax=Aegilops tauschii subsp. strangulata TaxID=200361 RepID=A0A453MCH4_AEGTS